MPAPDPVPPSGNARARRPPAAADTSVSRESVRTGSFVPGPADESVREPLPAAVGRFEILGLLGEGGFGRVYRARDPQLDREVALKVPRPGVLASPADRERFLREARAAATLQHPNLCPVHEVGQDGDCDYIVMAYVAGKSLAALLKERAEPMADRKIVPLVRKLALALDAAHQKGVVHRDLKPANILYNPARKDLVVTDFGLARRAKAGEAELTHSGMIVGTPAYMPPEQARGDVKAIGPAADVYSLGVILYELLTGRRPFTGTVGEVIGQVLHVEPEPPSKVWPGVNPQLEAICRKAMAKDPTARYASMREFAAALADLQQQPTTDAGSAATANKTASEETLGLRQIFDVLSHDRKESAKAVEAAIRKVKTPWWVWVASSGFVGVVTVLGIIYFPRTPTVAVLIDVKVDLADKSLSFVLDGKPISAEALAKPIDLKVGEHELVVWRGDKELERIKFSVHGGPDPTIVIEKPDTPPPDNSTGNDSDRDIRVFDPRGKWRGWVAGDRARCMFWVDSDGWHFRCTNHRQARHRHDYVLTVAVVGGTIDAVTPILTKGYAEGRIAPSDDKKRLEIDFHTNGPGREAGFDFQVSRGAKRLDIEFKKERGPKSIFIGADGQQPILGAFSLPVVEPTQPGPVPDTSRPKSDSPAADGFVPLFNGKDLTGWKVHPSVGPMPWTVEGGALMCTEAAKANILYTERGDYRDVHVRAECMFNQYGSGGLVVRAPFNEMTHIGYQAAIGAPGGGTPNALTGALRGMGLKAVVPVQEKLVPPRKWATVEFIVRGHHYVVKVDGKQTVDYEDGNKVWASGHIGLQFRICYRRSVKQVVWFRKVEVKELPSEAQPAPTPPVPMPRKADNPPAAPAAASPDRQAAELVLDLGGYFALEGQPDWFGGVGKGKADLPAGRIRVNAITLNDRPDIVRPEHFALFAQLEGLKSLHLHRSPFAGEGVAKLVASKSLEDFQPAECNLRDADLAPLASLASLTTLNLNHNEALTNACVDTLARLRKLRDLILTGTKVGDAGLEKLAQSGVPLTSLQVGTPVTDRGLKALGSIPTLRGLDVSGSLISATGLSNLTGAKALESLSVSSTATGDAGIPHLKGLKTLKSLNLNGTPVTNVGLEKLAQTGLALTELQVGCRGVSGRGLESLSRMTSLTSLNISETGVTNDSLSWLVPLKKLEGLSATNTLLSDGAVQHLAKLKGLKELDLTDTKVSPKALRALKQALPECSIEPAP